MKKIILLLCCFSFFYGSSIMVAYAQKYPKPKKVKTDKQKTVKEDDYYYDPYYDEEEYSRGAAWEQKGFELYIGAGAYFGSKKTANYYNGSPLNNIGVHLLSVNVFQRNHIYDMMKEAYPIMDTFVLRNDFNYLSTYKAAMDISLGAKYRVHKNWFLDLSYSFRRLTVSNFFIYDFPGVPPSNIEQPYYLKNYSRPEGLVAKEDRHYIDFSIGYLWHAADVFKPFISLGAQFNYIRINSFKAIIENNEFDLLSIARNPNYDPNIMSSQLYKDWAGAGYGFSLTAGVKIVVSPSVSLDPVFQMSMDSFGNNPVNLPGYNTSMSFNYYAGVRLILGDALFSRNK